MSAIINNFQRERRKKTEKSFECDNKLNLERERRKKREKSFECDNKQLSERERGGKRRKSRLSAIINLT